MTFLILEEQLIEEIPLKGDLKNEGQRLWDMAKNHVLEIINSGLSIVDIYTYLEYLSHITDLAINKLVEMMEDTDG